MKKEEDDDILKESLKEDVSIFNMIMILNMKCWFKDKHEPQLTLTCNESEPKSNRKFIARQVSNLLELKQFTFKEGNNMPKEIYSRLFSHRKWVIGQKTHNIHY